MAQKFADWDLGQRAIFGQLEQRTASHGNAVAAFGAAAVIAVLAPRLLPEFLNAVLNDDENAAQSADSNSDNIPTPSTLEPGPFAGDSIPARGPERDFTPDERSKVNEIGSKTGCHTCGTTDPGTKSKNFVLDHQPANKLNPSGGSQRLYPHCLSCSKRQGGQVRVATRRPR